MPKTALVAAQPNPRLAPLVRQYADALRPKWQSVVASARQFIPALLEFAVAYRDAYTEVKDNLGNEGVKALNAGIGLTDTAASRLRDIADANKLLSPHVALLPASVDAIHSVAVLATDEPRSFDRAIKHGDITPSLTVRDARSLQPTRRQKPVKTPAKAWTVVVSFDSRSEAGQTTARLLLENSGVSVRVSDSALRDDLKQALGKENWLKVEKRVTK
jgi:hypothetical protein